MNIYYSQISINFGQTLVSDPNNPHLNSVLYIFQMVLTYTRNEKYIDISM